MSRINKSFALIVAVFFVGLFIGQIVTEAFAHSGDDNLIHACVNNSSGTIKIVDPNTTCNNNWSPLDWNQQGLRGETGPSGPSALRNIEKITFDPIEFETSTAGINTTDLPQMSLTRITDASSILVIIDGTLANNCDTSVTQFEIVRDGVVVDSHGPIEKRNNDVGSFMLTDASTLTSGEHTWQLRLTTETSEGNSTCIWALTGGATFLEFAP